MKRVKVDLDKDQIVSILRESYTELKRFEVCKIDEDKIRLFIENEVDDDFYYQVQLFAESAKNALDEEPRWRTSTPDSYPGHLIKYFLGMEIIEGKVNEKSFYAFQLRRLNSSEMEHFDVNEDDEDENSSEVISDLTDLL